jgi:hypothetical protein
MNVRNPSLIRKRHGVFLTSLSYVGTNYRSGCPDYLVASNKYKGEAFSKIIYPH